MPKMLGKLMVRALLTTMVFLSGGLVHEIYSQTRAIVICHKTESASQPFVKEEVDAGVLSDHLEHGDRLPEGNVCLEVGEPVPEPITILLFGAGLAGVGYVARRRKQRSIEPPHE